jgi:hypothetical protein
MPTQCSRVRFGYEVVEGRRVIAAFCGGEVTSDAGALPLSVTDWAIGLLLLLPAALRVLRQAPVRGQAAALEHRRLSGRGRRGGAHHLPESERAGPG